MFHWSIPQTPTASRLSQSQHLGISFSSTCITSQTEREVPLHLNNGCCLYIMHSTYPVLTCMVNAYDFHEMLRIWPWTFPFSHFIKWNIFLANVQFPRLHTEDHYQALSSAFKWDQTRINKLTMKFGTYQAIFKSLKRLAYCSIQVFVMRHISQSLLKSSRVFWRSIFFSCQSFLCP